MLDGGQLLRIFTKIMVTSLEYFQPCSAKWLQPVVANVHKLCTRAHTTRNRMSYPNSVSECYKNNNFFLCKKLLQFLSVKPTCETKQHLSILSNYAPFFVSNAKSNLRYLSMNCIAPMENAPISLIFIIEDNISIYLPIYGSVQDVKKYQNPYLPIIESPGVVYLTNVKDDITAVSADLIKAILRAWPIMCFLLMGAAVSGVIVWALVRNCN